MTVELVLQALVQIGFVCCVLLLILWLAHVADALGMVHWVWQDIPADRRVKFVRHGLQLTAAFLAVGVFFLIHQAPQTKAEFTQVRQSFDTPVFQSERQETFLPEGQYSPNLPASQSQWDEARGAFKQ